MLSFGQRLKLLRKEADLSQNDLAEQLFVSVQSVSKWECDNAMPDIGQIVPLAAILGVTTDCLLGVGTDEKADREKLEGEIKEINKGIERVYSRNDNAYYESYRLYKEHIKKYPLDYEIKLQCADSIIRLIYYGHGLEEDKDTLYYEAINLLKSVINNDRDTTRIINARQTLVILYLYKNDFFNAENVTKDLPEIGSVKSFMELEIYSKKNDIDKCFEITEQICIEAVHHYLKALALKAKRLSMVRKKDAISVWHTLLESAKQSYVDYEDTKINTKWLYSGYNNLVNDYIELCEYDKAIETIEELTDILILNHNDLIEKGDAVSAEMIKGNFMFYLNSCYNRCFPTDDNIITNDPRYKECCQKLAAAIAELNS